MTLTFDWFLPTSGDGRTIYGRGHSLPLAQAQALPIPGERPPDIEYLGQVAGAAEQLGFAAVLTPTGTWCEDAWLATAALITQTVLPEMRRRGRWAPAAPLSAVSGAITPETADKSAGERELEEAGRAC